MHTKKTLIFFVSLCFISIAGIYYNSVNKAAESLDECDLSVRQCSFLHKDGEISVKFLSKIETEEELLLSIALPDSLQLEEAWIEGVNMYMGKTPIIPENDVFVTFLGSCNLEKMQWRLSFKVKNKNGQVENYSATFFTRRN